MDIHYKNRVARARKNYAASVDGNNTDVSMGAEKMSGDVIAQSPLSVQCDYGDDSSRNQPCVIAPSHQREGRCTEERAKAARFLWPLCSSFVQFSQGKAARDIYPKRYE